MSVIANCPLADTIAENLRTIRRNNRLTQKDLKTVLSCPMETLRRAEHGDGITDSMLVNFNLALGTNLRMQDAGQTVTIITHDECGHHCRTVGENSKCFVCEMLNRYKRAGWEVKA